MPKLMESPPYSPLEPVTEILHGVAVTDPYRWLEDQNSPRTRAWLDAQTQYARSYLDAIPGRERIRERIRELLDVETYDSIQLVGDRYFFRKRLPGKEQHCIFIREGPDGPDCLLIDPAERGTGNHTAVKPLRVSPDGRLLLYEVKEGGERSGTFELFDVESRKKLPDVFPRGYLRGFAFAPDCRSFYYVHEPLGSTRPHYRAVYRHLCGTRFEQDQDVFVAGEGESLRLSIVPGNDRLGIVLYDFSDKPKTTFYVCGFDGKAVAKPVIEDAEYSLRPVLMKDGRILVMTDLDAPNSRLVEIRLRKGLAPEFVDVIPTADVPIHNMAITQTRIFASYVRGTATQIVIYGHFGKYFGEIPIGKAETVRLLSSSVENDDLFLEKESFTKPIQIHRYSTRTGKSWIWAERKVPFEAEDFSHIQVWFTAKDGTRIPMFLVGCREALEGGHRPVVMTSYGGYGVPMTRQFSVFVGFLIERGCLFALPNIRGGSEFGVEWHAAAKRRNRQVAFDDFIDAAEWLIETERTEPQKFAIFGGSNSGLLVGAALTQRPELFRAVVCMVPILDMLRYHLFDSAHMWKEEFGTAEDPADFATLLNYSPYHRVQDGVPYPATMLVSGDADQNCNALHARKTTARLQAANASQHPIFLDYNRHRGHSPVLPLSERIEALTDRMAFLCDQLQLPV